MDDVHNHRPIAAWRNPHLWYITATMIACSIFYYLATIIELTGWPKPQWGILYTVHDLHRLLFLIPVLYAAHIFRLKGVIVTALISMLVFLSRAIFISLYPEALLRPIAFAIVIGGVGILLSKLLDSITERKQAEEKIQQQNDFLNNILESLTYPFYVIDANDYTIKMANPVANLGNLSEKLTCYALTHKSSKPCGGIEHVCPLEEVKKTKKPAVTEHIHYDEDGNVRNIEICGYPIFDTEGNIIQMIEYCLDITERKQAEEREEELQRELNLSSRLASIGELAAGVAHEINNPLTGILAFSERLLRKSTDKKSSRDLDRIYSEASRVAKVVENLRVFARRSEPKKEYSDINEILGRTLELRAYELKTSNVEVETVLAPDIPRVMVDFQQLQQVFLNIVLNAEQAMTEANNGGKLTIKTQPTKGYIRVSFADDGPGISAEQLDRVFDPFFTTRGERGGTGLGLSLCHGIVTEHGGRIYVRSKPGKGTTFFVELPLTSERQMRLNEANIGLNHKQAVAPDWR